MGFTRNMNKNIFSNLIITLFCLGCLIPFVLLISISFSNEQAIIKDGYSLLPRSFDVAAYKYIFKAPKELINAYEITILSTIIGTFMSLILMSMIAYPLSRKTYRHRNLMSFILFFTMLFNGGLVPSYILISQYLNMKDTFWVLIIPSLINVWHIILLRTFFQTIHDSLFESAKLDGASEIRIFYSIVLPLSKPVLATVALFGVLMRWNDWFTAMIYINDQKLITLQYLLQRIMMNIELLKNMSIGNVNVSQEINIPSESIRMAMAVLVAGPMIFVFPFFQKYFVKGVMVGSVKG